MNQRARKMPKNQKHVNREVWKIRKNWRWNSDEIKVLLEGNERPLGRSGDAAEKKRSQLKRSKLNKDDRQAVLRGLDQISIASSRLGRSQQQQSAVLLGQSSVASTPSLFVSSRLHSSSPGSSTTVVNASIDPSFIQEGRAPVVAPDGPEKSTQELSPQARVAHNERSRSSEVVGRMTTSTEIAREQRNTATPANDPEWNLPDSPRNTTLAHLDEMFADMEYCTESPGGLTPKK